MKTLLRSIPSGLYFQGPDRWTSNPAEALDFKMIDRAIKLATELNLDDVELAFAFDDLHVTAVAIDKLAVPYCES